MELTPTRVCLSPLPFISKTYGKTQKILRLSFFMYLKKRRWVGAKRNYRLESPLFRQAQTDLAAGAFININLEAGQFQRYQPFNFVQITNNTNQELILFLGANFVKSIPSGTIQSIDEETMPAFRSIQLQNATAALAAGNIEIVWQKVVSQRMILRGDYEA